MDRISKQENSTPYTEAEIMAVWRSEWQNEVHTSIKTQFSRLFVEGYRVYKKYLPPEDQPFTLLEIGAGSGRYGVAIARDYRLSKVTITDPLVESTHLIRGAVRELNLTNVVVQEEDSLNLSFPDNSFDVVFADVVIQHIIDTDTALSEMLRVLKPKGKLILSVVNTRNPFHFLYKKLLSFLGKEYHYGYERTYTRSEFKELFKRTGITEVTQDGFYCAYGMYRWGYTYKIFKLCGRILNRIIGYTERAFGRIISPRYGFIIVCIGTKP